MSETKGLTNDLLKSKMVDAMVNRLVCTDLDSCRTPGYYILRTQDAVCADPPKVGGWNYGLLEVLDRGGSNWLQRISTVGGLIVYRWGNSTSWGPWRQVITQAV